jgi:hypothetical protein
MRIVVDAGGVIRMWSLDAPAFEAPPDGAVIDLTEDQAAAFAALPPNAGVTFDGQGFVPIPPPPAPELTPEQKLAAVGLTAADLKQLLGLS